MKNSFLHVLAILCAGLILLAAILFGGPRKTASSYEPSSLATTSEAIGAQANAQASSTLHVQKAPEKIATSSPDALDLWLDKLSALECRHCGTHFRRLDTNDKYSYGCLQFQAATFETYAIRYGIIEAGEDFLTDTIYSCSVQRQIARRMYADLSPAAFARNWFYSVYVRGLGLPKLET